jgi:uncharacterized OsmC-like protein
MGVRAKELRFAIDLSASGELSDEQGVVLAAPPEWSPEHLVLAGLVGCSLKSLRHHAKRSSVDVLSASAGARTLVTRRDRDGRYAMVETEIDLAVEIDPEPEPTALADLLALAERDCFVGSSLTARPTYRWTVNGRVTGT